MSALVLLEQAPTAAVLRRWRESGEPAAGRVLARRGLEPCAYCRTVAGELHWSEGCPELLAGRLGL